MSPCVDGDIPEKKLAEFRRVVLKAPKAPKESSPKKEVKAVKVRPPQRGNS